MSTKIKQSPNHQDRKAKQEGNLSPCLTSLLTNRITTHWLAINLSFLTFFATTNSVSASPVCYMIYTHNNTINLSYLCGSAKSSRTSHSNNPTITNSNSEKPDSETIGAENSADNSESQLENEDESANPAHNADNNNSEKEIDRSELPVIQKTIPLIQRQRSPETIDD